MPSTSREALTRQMARYRARKRVQGFCIYGGCWEPAATRDHCRAHADRHSFITTRNRRCRRAEANIITAAKMNLKLPQTQAGGSK